MYPRSKDLSVGLLNTVLKVLWLSHSEYSVDNGYSILYMPYHSAFISSSQNRVLLIEHGCMGVTGPTSHNAKYHSNELHLVLPYTVQNNRATDLQCTWNREWRRRSWPKCCSPASLCSSSDNNLPWQDAQQSTCCSRKVRRDEHWSNYSQPEWWHQLDLSDSTCWDRCTILLAV